MKGCNTQEAWVVLGQICVRKKSPIKRPRVSDTSSPSRRGLGQGTSEDRRRNQRGALHVKVMLLSSKVRSLWVRELQRVATVLGP